MLEILKHIRSLDELKQKEEELLAIIEEIMRASLQLFRNLIETTGSMAPEEIEKELAKFQDERTFLSEESVQEFNRIDRIPGAMMFMQSFMEVSTERTTSFRQEFLKILPQLVETLEGKEGGITPDLRAMIDQMGADSRPPSPPGASRPLKKDRVKLKELEMIYNVKSIDDLKRDKDRLFEIFEGAVKDNIKELQAIKSAGISGKDAQDKFDEIESRLESYGNEVEMEMARLTELPGGTRYIEIFNEEMRKRLQPNIMEMEELLSELRR